MSRKNLESESLKAEVTNSSWLHVKVGKGNLMGRALAAKMIHKKIKIKKK